jgi:uncharacterized coiled-coil DUF342 family protein
MDKLSLAKRQNILRQYFNGLSYDEITAKTGVSKGSVSNVIAGLKAGDYPEAADLVEQIETLRELSLELNRLKTSPGRCAVGLMVLDRINGCGLMPSDIDRLPLILESVGGEAEAREFIGHVHGIQEVLSRTGLSVEGLESKVRELEKRAAEVEPVAKKRDELRKQLVDLDGQRKDLTSVLANLKEKYNFLAPRVKDLEKREQELLSRNKSLQAEAEKAESALGALKREKKVLADIGLSPEILADISRVAQVVAKRYGLTSSDLMSRLGKELKNLDKALGLEMMIKAQQKELKEQKQSAALAQQELENLMARIGSSKKEKIQLDASLKSIREEIDSTINGIVPSARKAFDQCRKELQGVHDETVKASKEVGRLQQIVAHHQWIMDLLPMMQANGVVEAKKVRDSILLVILYFSAWLKKQERNPDFVFLAYSVNSLIKDLDKWKT